MNYRKMGKTGLTVSEISLGCWLTYGHSIEKESTQAIIERAYDLGINMFDCCGIDILGESQRIMGDILSRYNRDSYILTTQASYARDTNPNKQWPSRKNLHSQIHTSLKQLNTDYIDIFYLHHFDTDVDLYETLRTLDDFIRQGKILYIGVTEWTSLQIVEGLKIQDHFLLDQLVVNQFKHNLLYQDIDCQIFNTTSQHGIGMIAYSPLAEGFLSGKYRKGKEIPKDSRAANDEINKSIKSYLSPNNFDIIEKFLQFADQKACTAAQLAIKWLLSKDGVVSALLGISQTSQIEENIKALDIILSAEDVSYIEKLFTKKY